MNNETTKKITHPVIVVFIAFVVTALIVFGIVLFKNTPANLEKVNNSNVSKIIEETDIITNNELVFIATYKNDHFGISFDLPSEWSYDESPSFIDGVMTYNGRNLSFTDKSKDNYYGFGLSIDDNIANYLSIEQYVFKILEENERLFNQDEVPYKWEYDKKYNLVSGENLGYVIENLKGPGGEEDKIFMVGEEYIYKFSYSYTDEDGISRVNDELRGKIKEILNTLIIDL